MVKTELSYNPYLMETVVKFNDQPPKINSIIEKYRDKKLQEWVELLPQVFRDEMNGYGFDFYFSGTESDYELIKSSFKKAGVTDNEVAFFYKNELEEPVIKNKRIYDVFSWLDAHPNRRFDYKAFKDDNKEILDSPYSFITINGNKISSISLCDEKIDIENIDNVNELTTTDLTNTPIVMFIDSHDLNRNKRELRSIICRDDISSRQLFFCISAELNRPQIERIISDLGIHTPNIINDVNDAVISDYFEVYPLTEYITKVLEILKGTISKLQADVDEENEKSKIVNSGIHRKIDSLENDINTLKNADDLFNQRDNLIIPTEYVSSMKSFFFKISEWRKKKTKTTNMDEAIAMATEFNTMLDKFYSEFVSEIDNASVAKSAEIDQLFGKWFSDTKMDPDFEPTVDFNYEAKEYITPSLTEKFMDIKTEQYIVRKASLFDRLKNNADANNDKVMEVTYTYEAWRTLAVEEYGPICQRVIDNWTETLTKYYAVLANVYHNRIHQIIKQKTEEKQIVSKQLSQDEQLLQNDMDWLSQINDKLHLIERG